MVFNIRSSCHKWEMQRHISRAMTGCRISAKICPTRHTWADGLRSHRTKLSCSSWSSVDRAVITAYDLASLPIHSSISFSWIDWKEFRNSRQLNISRRSRANSRSVVSCVTVWSDSSKSRAMHSSFSGSLIIVPLDVSNSPGPPVTDNSLRILIVLYVFSN
jgi:hypothetical protein